LARAREQDRDRFDPVWQAHGDPLARFEARFIEIGGDGIDNGAELAPRKPSPRVPHRESLGPARRMVAQQRVERIPTP
jgi:hypothetical protein